MEGNTSVFLYTESSRKEYRLNQQNLAKVIASQNVNFEAIAVEWFNILKTRADEAMNILLGLLYDSARHSNITIESDSQGAPLLILSTDYQKRLSLFFKNLMTLQIIGQMSLMKRLCTTLVNMSNSKRKFFRLTAIVVANQLILSLLEAEMIVTSANLSGNQSDLDKDNTMINKEKDLINIYLNCLFKEIIRFRARDVESEIRMKVVSSVLEWIIQYPNKMAVDCFMKFINRFICDKSASIRCSAVRAIMEIISKIKDIGILCSFLKNNVPKLLVRINDVDKIVGEAAIKALDLIDSFSYFEMDYEQIYLQIYSTDRNKMLAAGHFLLRKLGENDSEEDYLVDLVKFQLESPMQEHGEFLISSVFKNLPFLTYWEKWINCLNNQTDVNKRVIICQLLLHTIRIAATGQVPPFPRRDLIFYPVDEAQPKELLNTSDQITCVNHQKSITEYFGKRLVNLLKQYKDAPKYLFYFLAIPQYFESSIDPMMMIPVIDEIQHIALTSEDLTVINNAFYHLAIIANKVPKEWKELSSRKQENLVTKMVVQYFIPIANNLISNEETEMTDEEVEVNLGRTMALARCFNLTNTHVWRLALKGLNNSIQKHNFVVIKMFANICYQNVMWKKNEIIDSLKVFGHPSEEEVVKLKFLNHELLGCAIKILSLNTSHRIKSMAFVISCNLLMIFSKRNTNMKQVISAAIYPTEAQLEWLAHFLNTSVPDSFEAGTTPSSKDEQLLSKYCKLLENNIIPTSNVANIILYFQTEAYNKILTPALHSLLRNEITMKSTVTSIIYALEVLLERCQKKENLSEQVLQNILEGICTSLHPRYSGLEKAVQEVQVIGLECVYMIQNKTFFNILEFFVPLIRKSDNVKKLQVLVTRYFPHLTDKQVVKSYVISLKEVKEALECGNYSPTTTTDATDDEEFAGSSAHSMHAVWNVADSDVE